MNPSKPEIPTESDESNIEGTSIPRKVCCWVRAREVVGRKIPEPQQMTNESKQRETMSMNDEFDCSLRFQG